MYTMYYKVDSDTAQVSLPWTNTFIGHKEYHFDTNGSWIRIMSDIEFITFNQSGKKVEL